MARFSQSTLSVALLLSSVVAASSNFAFTYPKPGKNDYTFADGDTALVSWTPSHLVIPRIALNCGPIANVYGNAVVTGTAFKKAKSPSVYHAHWIQQEANHTYCMFCSGPDELICSGAFHLVNSKPGVAPTTWSLNMTNSGSRTSNTTHPHGSGKPSSNPLWTNVTSTPCTSLPTGNATSVYNTTTLSIITPTAVPYGSGNSTTGFNGTIGLNGTTGSGGTPGSNITINTSAPPKTTSSSPTSTPKTHSGASSILAYLNSAAVATGALGFLVCLAL